MSALIYLFTCLFVIAYIASGKVIQNSCGTLTIWEPVLKYGLATFSFVPFYSSKRDSVIWRIRTPGSEWWKTVQNTSNIRIYKNYLGYNLQFSNYTETENTEYRIIFYGDYVDAIGCGVQTEVSITVSPTKLMFVNTRDFEGCEQCVHGPVANTITIICNITGGSQPLLVDISVSQIRKHALRQQALDLTAGGTYWTSWRVEEEDHLKEVKCEVHNNALNAPIVTLSKLYITRQPQPPELHIDDLQEGAPINVSCSATGGRPAANITMFLSDTTLPAESVLQTNTRESSGNFTSTAVLTSMKREWNGRALQCCISHELLERKECSKAMSIDYTFPPESVTIRPLQPISVDRPYHRLHVACVITNANPSCSAELNFKDSVISSTIAYNQTTSDQGYTTINVAFIDVSKDDSGESIVCSASCKEFDSEKSDNYILYVPYAPIIEINASTPTTHVMEGTTVVLQCTAKSRPFSNISWMKRHHNTSLKEHICGSNNMCLGIVNIQLEDSGVYICRVDNRIFGSTTKDIEIKVIENEHAYDNSTPSKLVLWPWVVGSVAAAVFLTVGGLLLRRIVSKLGNGQQSGSQEMHITERGPLTNTLISPQDGLNTERHSDTYDIIRGSGIAYQQDHPETSQNYDRDYLHPVFIESSNTTTMDTAELNQNDSAYYLHPIHREYKYATNQEQGCLYMDMNSKTQAGNFSIVRANEQDHSETSHGPVNKEDDYNISLYPEQLQSNPTKNDDYLVPVRR